MTLDEFFAVVELYERSDDDWMIFGAQQKKITGELRWKEAVRKLAFVNALRTPTRGPPVVRVSLLPAQAARTKDQ